MFGTDTRIRLAVALLAATCLLAACNEPPAVNPWADDGISRCTWNTPSSQYVMDSGTAPVVRDRGFPQRSVARVRPGVPHYPLYFMDPFEGAGDGDEMFAWTGMDYLAMPYSVGRWAINGIALPVSLIVDLPGTSRVSDGVIDDRGYDQVRGTSPDPTATKADFIRAPEAPVADPEPQKTASLH